MNPRRLLARLAHSQTNVKFADLVRLAEAFGFVLDRTSGSHRIFIHSEHREAQLNLQPDRSGNAKAYQVQLLALVEEYNLSLERSE